MSDRLADHSDQHALQVRTGLLAGLLAYVMWGLLPIYFKLLHGVLAVEIVAHRVVWSVVFLALVLTVQRLFPQFLQALRQPRIVAALALSAILIALNWLVYVWAVGAHHVVAASLGYFLNPMVNVLLGMLVLKERLRRGQMVAILIALAGVAVLALDELQTLWISLTLAVSFALYGLVRKLTPVPSSVGLAVETLLLTPAALAALAWISHEQGIAFGDAPPITAALVGLGAITSVPLMLFAVAARSLRMITLGLMQYLSPSLQFLSGVLLFNEQLTSQRWASFLLIWTALALFIADSLRGIRRQ